MMPLTITLKVNTTSLAKWGAKILCSILESMAEQGLVSAMARIEQGYGDTIGK